MKLITRPIRFEEVDAAQIVFFARYLQFSHEAMEAFFDELDGGYVALVRDRKIGLPAVHVDIDYKAPCRYGDVLTIATTVTHVGNSSCTLHYEHRRQDDVLAAVVSHTCVVSDLVRLKGIPIPDDMRALLEQHRVVAG